MKRKYQLKHKKFLKPGKKVIGYHVYRSENENLPVLFWPRLTDDPIPEGASFNDQADNPGKRYFYKLTKVYEDGSESAHYTPETSYTDHAGNKHAQNPLKDFKGYNMYRSADENTPLDQWERRNKEPIPTTEYKDEGVESGEIYFYYVRAVDSAGNESAPSEIIRVIRK